MKDAVELHDGKCRIPPFWRLILKMFALIVFLLWFPPNINKYNTKSPDYPFTYWLVCVLFKLSDIQCDAVTQLDVEQ